ncbi:cysteine desulfurase, partial [Streptococcus ruminantium]|nr:cysteine desulfurase [Streptococcus ruminantium]
MYGKESPRLKESIRISLSETNTKQEIDTLIVELKKNNWRLKMAFQKSVTLKDCNFTYHISPVVKKYTLRDNTFEQ